MIMAEMMNLEPVMGKVKTELECMLMLFAKFGTLNKCIWPAQLHHKPHSKSSVCIFILSYLTISFMMRTSLLILILMMLASFVMVTTRKKSD
jgi:hypothetical protein